jgi:hypothetical protein
VIELVTQQFIARQMHLSQVVLYKSTMSRTPQPIGNSFTDGAIAFRGSCT